MGDRFYKAKGTSGPNKPPIEVKIEGYDDLKHFFDSFPKEIQKKIVLDAFREGAKVIHARAVSLAPRSGSATSNAFNRAAAKTGSKKHLFEKIKILRPSLRSMKEARDVVYKVFVKHPLAYIAEYGTTKRFHASGKATGHMPAYSYMRRAVDEKGSEAIAVITARTRVLIDKAVKRLARKKNRRK